MGTVFSYAFSPEWSANPPAAFALDDREVHVWRFHVPAANDVPGLQAGEAVLTQAEKDTAARFRRQEDAARYRTARANLRLLSARYLGLSPAAVRVDGGGGEKPFLGNAGPRPLHFNLTHSGETVLIAFCRTDVGIDCEWVDAGFAFEDIVAGHFSMAEAAGIRGAAEPATAFYRAWTRKEALAKALGAGLTADLRSLPGGEGSFLIPELTGDWQIAGFSADPGYPAALAAGAGIGQIRCFRNYSG